MPSWRGSPAQTTPLPEKRTRPPIPWITQYATASLIAAIAYQGHPAADDPNWRASGAPTREAYGRWCTRLCGMACLRMALFARDGHAPSLFTLLGGCLEYGGYVEEPGGGVRGLLYRQFSDFTRDQLPASRPTSSPALTPGRMRSELRPGPARDRISAQGSPSPANANPREPVAIWSWPPDIRTTR